MENGNEGDYPLKSGRVDKGGSRKEGSKEFEEGEWRDKFVTEESAKMINRLS